MRADLILFLCLLLGLGGCATNPSLPSTLVSPTPLISSLQQTATATVYFDPTRTPLAFYTPTPLADDPEVAQLLANLNGDCRTLCILQTLEYLRAHPVSPYHAQLSDGALNGVWNESPMDWFAEQLLHEKLIEPLNREARVPSEFLEWLNRDDHGEWFETDLDGDNAPDYVVSIRWGREFYPGQMYGGLYWTHRVNKEFILTRISTQSRSEASSLRPQIYALRDLNGDTRADVAFIISECGNGCTSYLRIVTWGGAQWRILWSANSMGVDGGYVFSDLANGAIEITATEREGPTLGSGPVHDYTVHFLYRGNLFVPVALSSALPREEWDKSGKPIQFAQQLLYAHQFHDAVWVLESIAQDMQTKDTQTKPPFDDYRPYYWYHKGMTHLLDGDVPNAQRAWDQLRARFPNSKVSRDVEKNRVLVKQPDDIWKFCNALRAQNADWTPPPPSVYGANSHTMLLYSWQAECAVRLLLPLQTFSNDPLDQQLLELGLQWHLLSDEFDLNRDGVRDSIGVIETDQRKESWVFLSDGGSYHALYATQSYPHGALDLDSMRDDYDWRSNAIVVTDLDQDKFPEIVLEDRVYFLLWRWNGERFERMISDFSAQFDRRMPFTVTTTADGTRELVTELESKDGALQGKSVYRLENGELKSLAFLEYNPQVLSDALAELFWHQRPHAALDALAQFAPNPDEEAMLAYLRALAYEYANEQERARAEFFALIQKYPDGGWASLAQAHAR